MESKEIKARVIIEVVGSPKAHVEETLNKLIETIKSDSELVIEKKEVFGEWELYKIPGLSLKSKLYIDNDAIGIYNNENVLENQYFGIENDPISYDETKKEYRLKIKLIPEREDEPQTLGRKIFEENSL